jgi:hypothetical protein
MPTIGFSNKRNAWTSRYSYAASCFARVNNKFFSSPASPSTNGSSDGPIWEHDSGSSYNNFHGTTTPSEFNVTFADKPSTNKIYKTLSIEGTKNLGGSFCFVKTSNALDENAISNDAATVDILRNVNGTTYGPIPNSNVVSGGKNLIVLGRLRRNRQGVAVSNVPANDSGVHPAFFKAYLDPNSGVSPEIQHNKEIPMKILAMTGQTIITDTDDITVDQVCNLTYQDLSLKITAKAVHPSFAPSPFYIPYDPQDFTINFSEGTSLAGKINTAVPLGDVYLVGLIHPSFAGDTSRGQYAEARVQVPSNKGYFEVYSMNMQYEPIQLAHDK